MVLSGGGPQYSLRESYRKKKKAPFIRRRSCFVPRKQLPLFLHAYIQSFSNPSKGLPAFLSTSNPAQSIRETFRKEQSRPQHCPMKTSGYLFGGAKHSKPLAGLLIFPPPPHPRTKQSSLVSINYLLQVGSNFLSHGR